jgi:ribonuclease P/MRP protein subunit RPP1
MHLSQGLKIMEIINTPNLNDARKIIQKIKKENPEEAIAVKAQDEEFNRKILETKDVNVLLSPEIHNRKDKLKQRDSGLNEVLCKIAAKNKIKIGIMLEDLIKKQGKEKAIILARIMQNIMLCKKVNCDIILVGKYDKKDAFSFLITLGASTQQAKKAVEKA